MKSKKGGATKESLMAVASVDEKGLASQLTYIRMTGITLFSKTASMSLSQLMSGTQEELQEARHQGLLLLQK